MLFHVLKSINNNSNRSNTVPSSLLYSHAFIRRCIRTGFCSPDLADFHDLYISSDEKLFYKILTCPNNGHSCHHLLHKITVLEIDLTIDSYLTAFLDCNFTVRMLYRNMYWLLYILDLRFVLFLCTTAVWQFAINKYVMLLCYAQLCQSGQRCWLWDLWMPAFKTLAAGRKTEYNCDEHARLCIFPPDVYLWNRMSRLCQIVCKCYIWLWLCPPTAALRYVAYFRFCGWRHVCT